MSRKIDPWADLVSDRAKEIAGVRCDVPNCDWWFQLRRKTSWNEDYYIAYARLTRSDKFKDVFERCIEGDEDPTTDDALLIQELEMMAFIEGCVIDGQFTSREGEDVSATDPKAVLGLFLAMPALFNWARNQAQDIGNFGPEPDKLEKN